jgi:hypothetical protein
VTRRASLPGADVLFRGTPGPQPSSEEGRSDRAPGMPELGTIPPPAAAASGTPTVGTQAPEQGPARPRHDEKITFYCTGSELTRLEKARLALRSEHKLPSDRGRIVRAALTEMLEDFEAKGSHSALLRRLSSDS